MGYQRGNDRFGGGDDRYGGDDRWRDRGDRWGGGSERGSYDRARESGGRSREDEDRGFFERAGEQVRSWFGDDDDARGRGGRRYENERGGSGGFGGGWGNQQGDSWNRDRPGVRAGGSDGDFGRERSGGGRGGYARDYQASGGGSDRFEEGGYGGASRSTEFFGGSGFGGAPDHGRRFDRIDAGSTGTQGAHPMSSPVGGAYGAGYGAAMGGGYGSSARTAAMLAGRGAGGEQGGSFGGSAGNGGRSRHDPHYSEWRNRQIEQLDSDYEEYCRENQSRFEQEFGGWREKRQTQRSSLGRVTEHMEVLGSDGQHIGTVDAVKGDRIVLTKNDENAGGIHHSIPCSWIEKVEDKVTVNKTAEEAMAAWRDEERNRAMFEREDQGSEGPHMLNRSFSGTY